MLIEKGIINLKNKKYVAMVHALCCISTQILTFENKKDIEKAKHQLATIEDITQKYGEDSEFLHNFYQISYCPFKKEMDKTMIF